MTELYKLKTAYEESLDQIETVRKENKTLSGAFCCTTDHNKKSVQSPKCTKLDNKTRI